MHRKEPKMSAKPVFVTLMAVVMVLGGAIEVLAHHIEVLPKPVLEEVCRIRSGYECRSGEEKKGHPLDRPSRCCRETWVYPVGQDQCTWDGTAPFCSGGCFPNETEVLKRSNSLHGFYKKFGASCYTGTKSHCCTVGRLTTPDPKPVSLPENPFPAIFVVQSVLF